MSDHRNASSGLRLARTNYSVRTASFAYCFLVIGLVLVERKMGMLAWGLLALQFLAYPQLAYLHAKAAKDARRAEIRNLHADSLMLGAWVAMLGFPTWIAYGLLFSTTLNIAILRGWPGVARATSCFAAGALAWVAPMGLMHYPGTTDLVAAMCFFGSLAYSVAVGLVVRRQNGRLRFAREQVRAGERHLEVAGLAFERMAEAMMITNAAGRILMVNRSFTRITGHEAADVLGQPESRFRSGMQAESFYDDIYATVLRTGQWRGSSWCRRRDGTVYREWRSVSAVRDADSRVTHYVVLFGELNGQAGEGEESPAKSA